MNLKRLKAIIPCALACFLGVCTRATAQTAQTPQTPQTPQTFEPQPSGPFCGINCLYTALRTEGVDVDMAALMQNQYVGSDSGSTVAELMTAARDHHAYALALTNLSVADLRHLQKPAILHIKSAYDALAYDHFILCVPVGAELHFYDPPNPAAKTSGHELAALWDGTAIVVSAQPIALGEMRLWAGARTGLTAAVILGLAAVGVLIRRGFGHRFIRLSPLGQVAVLGATGAGLAIAYHLSAPEGFAAQRQALVTINHSRFDPAPTAIDLAEAQRLLARGATFVDARRAGDFAEGHVPGAVNLPPTSSRTEIDAALKSRAEGRPLVIYCANPSCLYADHLARRLRRCGYENLQLFPGGFSQWQANRVDQIESSGWTVAGVEGGI